MASQSNLVEVGVRAISLSDPSNKIISKVPTNRLRDILLKTILPLQETSPEKLIYDNMFSHLGESS